ncbi:hypothetical protein DFH28DRAFT_1078899 [Melampsora americana]|nr:hypothetical protein DFH28DRAFT_1078899 [Melampsora americana]
MYKYDEVSVRIQEATKENPSMDGFVKQTCYERSFNNTGEPYCIYANPTFSNNRGMVLFIRPSFLTKKLQEFSIFKTEENVITDAERAAFPYELVHMPHKGGLGSLATKKLQLGDRVVTDHALVTVFARSQNWQRDDWMVILKDMVDHLPIKGREIFARQHGVGNTELEWVASAFDRNVFSASQDDEEQGGFAFVPEPAYFNHACRPNVAFYFDDVTLQIEMYAVRDIAPGEELFSSYFQIDFSWEVRQATLQHHYGFKCGCSQCSLPPWGARVSDDRLLKIKELTGKLTNWNRTKTPATTAMADYVIELYKMEHMHASMDSAYSYASLTYNSFGESDKASMYATLAISYGMYIHGPDWPSYQAHALLESSPKSHWSYGSRLPGGQAYYSPKNKSDDTSKQSTTFSLVKDEL